MTKTQVCISELRPYSVTAKTISKLCDQLRQTIEEVFNDLCHNHDFIRMLGATTHAVLSRMRRCIAIGGRQSV
jgi:hypothetical protein